MLRPYTISPSSPLASISMSPLSLRPLSSAGRDGIGSEHSPSSIKGLAAMGPDSGSHSGHGYPHGHGYGHGLWQGRDSTTAATTLPLYSSSVVQLHGLNNSRRHTCSSVFSEDDDSDETTAVRCIATDTTTTALCTVRAHPPIHTTSADSSLLHCMLHCVLCAVCCVLCAVWWSHGRLCRLSAILYMHCLPAHHGECPHPSGDRHDHTNPRLHVGFWTQ
jgi:hypothetical protein